ncbi:phosphate acetyltransferase [soil metagenome]
MFLDSMKSRVQGKKRRVLYAEGKEAEVLQAASMLKDKDLAIPVLMGDPDELHKAGKKLNVDFEGIEIHNPKEDKNFDRYVQEYYELRKHKGLSEKEAEETMRKPHFFGAMMVHLGAADGLVSGLSSETKPFIPAFEIIGLRDGFKRASSVFVLELPEQLLFFADCAVNINPDAQGMAEIAYATVETVRWFGVEPRVAFLSFSTHAKEQDGELIGKIKEATEIAKKLMPYAIIDGEIQFDAAMLPEVARKKAPDSPFVEKGANVFIFPDLNSGNIAYKITERVGRARATGPILQGLKKPVNDVSRGCSAEDLVNAGVITAALVQLDDTVHSDCL